MATYLLFTLCAPLASFGAVAAGERRSTWDRPGKSQIIGLIAGCLGIERSDEAGQANLAAGLGFAVRIDHPGVLETDYHTTQAPKEVELKRWAKKHGPVRTRADELATDDLKTILSQREFRTGSHYTVALWRTGDRVPTLAALQSALVTPVFAPFAGRKANPLMLPFAPHVLDAARIEDAFPAFDALETSQIRALKSHLRLKLDANAPIYADSSAVPVDERAARVSRLEERRDLPESRSKWRFGLRSEVLLKSPPGTSNQGDQA